MQYNSNLNRREFLQRAAVSTVGIGILNVARGGPVPRRESLASVTPEQVGVNPQALQEAIDFISKEFAAKTFPGAALVATRGGRKFVEKYWGTCSGPDRDSIPYDASARNMMYSFSKAITATITVMAHQDGLVDYDVPVSKYIGEFTGGGKESITVRHVLTHSAGLSAAPLIPTYSESQWKAAIAKLCAMEVEWVPGSRTAYHGYSGMLIAAEVVRRVSGNKPWNDICRERLFDPLDSGFTFRIPTGDAPIALVSKPKSYPWPMDTDHEQSLGHPSAGAFARTDDMLKLLNLHLNNGIWNGKTLIQPDALKEMHRVQYQKQIDASVTAGQVPKHEFWGLGWLLRGTTKESWFGFGNVASAQTFSHAGVDTVIGLADPANDVAMVFMTTASPGDAAVTMRLRNTVTNKVMAAASGNPKINDPDCGGSMPVQRGRGGGV
ncbi:MAG: serine hydrolase [Verrucomicrobia bacterium]|nr:serine hydrolase [Verrucomicrobiota bacterium]